MTLNKGTVENVVRKEFCKFSVYQRAILIAPYEPAVFKVKWILWIPNNYWLVVTRRPSVGLDRRLLKSEDIYFKFYLIQIQVIFIKYVYMNTTQYLIE